ncbi:large ribosomal subunit protein mL38 isoform X1 [Pantherophis guttatus]|uniref:Large ribosomal subunit protein mL38 n=2 Tax=Pantherophis guttatus TaxID=94885 RepID=A0A6P9B915_PANGU|nr:large ribosomal subunit protein mL38 isoform X1 [Pantherophis guttatus]XP_060544655.1 large ribosomal subunit protein mL38 isoform X1 [Pantherophis guttatus]
MAAPVLNVALRGFRNSRGFSTTAVLCKLGVPLGPMPNEDIDVSNLEALEKYRVFTRYFKVAEKENKKTPWWRTYKKYITPEEDKEAKIDIGLPSLPLSRRNIYKERKAFRKQNLTNPELEKASWLKTLQIPLDDVKAEWERTSGPYHKQRLAEHYGLYRDLFDNAMFVPRVLLKVEYNQDENYVMPVYYGNVVTPTEAFNPPEVSFEADEGTLWTLLLTNLDGHLSEGNLEYVHWLVGNIPGNQIEAGQEICHYFPAFPARGTGYHRYVFLLFKQHQPIDFTEDVRPTPCHSLKMRTFKTFDFYKKHQSDMTPAGLAFFQCEWDKSVTNIFYELLNMKEPVFDFVRPPRYHPPQKKYPHREPLRYLDRYRDSNESTYGIY